MIVIETLCICGKVVKMHIEKRISMHTFGDQEKVLRDHGIFTQLTTKCKY